MVASLARLRQTLQPFTYCRQALAEGMCLVSGSSSLPSIVPCNNICWLDELTQSRLRHDMRWNPLWPNNYFWRCIGVHALCLCCVCAIAVVSTVLLHAIPVCCAIAMLLLALRAVAALVQFVLYFVPMCFCCRTVRAPVNQQRSAVLYAVSPHIGCRQILSRHLTERFCAQL
ncbi:hypothetical protein COO60DRAFT_771899 [Scenedesmus sp. NREL 46B-D3]|nr:hypothetical protein COO60DRAFT_771899 [Scenedesmus sp. NREL 46B-D3]